MIDACLYELLNETDRIETMVSSTYGQEFLARMAKYDDRFRETSLRNNSSYYSFGNGSHHCLFFAYDTSIATNGLVILCNLLQRGSCNFEHLPLTWHLFIASNEKHENSKNQDTRIITANHQVDTMISVIDSIKPAFSLVMRDFENANSTTLPGHIGISRPLNKKIAHSVSNLFDRFQLPLDTSFKDSDMGEGFYMLNSISENRNNPNLTSLVRHGQTMIINPGQNQNDPGNLVFLQLAPAFIAIDYILENF